MLVVQHLLIQQDLY